MAGNSTGQLFRVTTFGESHGPAIGVVIDGCLPGLNLDIDFITHELKRRKPGQSMITTSRNEEEEIEVLAGLFEGKTTGSPLCIIVRNKDQKPGDYEALKNVFRPSHADFTTQARFGIRDHRGSGRASARETLARVIAGAVAKQMLGSHGIKINAYVSAVGTIALTKNYKELYLEDTEKNIVRCPDPETATKMIELIEHIKSEGDTVGGSITCVISGVMPGIGDPVFDKLHADLGKAVLSINACKGIEFGSGFEGTTRKGSEENDEFTSDASGNISLKSNRSGGIQGGISNGEDIYFRAAFKPVSSIQKIQHTVSVSGENIDLDVSGRHDPCVLPRAVAIVEAMSAIIIADHYLRLKALK